MGRDMGPLATLVAAYAAPGAPSQLDPIEISEIEWPSLRPVLAFHRLTGLAMASVAGGALRLPESAAKDPLDLHREAMTWALAVERAALEVTRALEDAAIAAVVLKGPSFAHRFYADPSLRPFGDLDLLVSAADLTQAGVVLENLGIPRTLPEPRPGFDRRFGTGSIHRTPDGIEIDVHRTLVQGPFGLWMSPDELLDATDGFVLGGRTLRCLDDTASLLHACVHAALGALPPLLMPLRDIAEIADSGRIDWARLDDWAARWRLRAVIGHAFETTTAVLGVRLPPQAFAAATARVSRRERRALLAYTSDLRRRGGRARATLWAIPGVRGKAAYLRALSVPSGAFLTARQGTERSSYRRRWATPIRWLLRRP